MCSTTCQVFGFTVKNWYTCEQPMTNFSSINPNQIDLARLLISRLERLSVDSLWAHRASGVRRSLLRCLDELPLEQTSSERLAQLIQLGFHVVENAAREMGDRQDWQSKSI